MKLKVGEYYRSIGAHYVFRVDSFDRNQDYFVQFETDGRFEKWKDGLNDYEHLPNYKKSIEIKDELDKLLA